MLSAILGVICDQYFWPSAILTQLALFSLALHFWLDFQKSNSWGGFCWKNFYFLLKNPVSNLHSVVKMAVKIDYCAYRPTERRQKKRRSALWFYVRA